MIFPILAVCHLIHLSKSHILTVTNYNVSWKTFKETHNKIYETAKEEQLRKSVFLYNKEKINQHNLEYEIGLHTYTMGVNQFTDLTEEEFFDFYTMKASQDQHYTFTQESDLFSSIYKYINISQLPKDVDWRKYNVVSRVKNQGHCGACWAFATTGALEAQWARRTKKLVSLSEQNLVDCSWFYGNHGCSGGWMENAIDYIINNHGIDTEQSYPYLARNFFCHYNPRAKGATASQVVLTKNELELQAAVATVGPVAVAIEVSSNFYKYSRGVYDDDACGQNANHALLVVGYGVEEGKPYWLVKNSWGPSWGEEGYIKMVRNRNLCGIADHGTYPVV
ncbi:procathepsin L-like [Anthonomus grandis grandis]|uniref:procathepsin L-like n=1 Tax=Anthonomus grandis grandis TaxID=2921223 RepID=UPI002165BF5F|nr:procathepsin L-like [Anthonomus grandis grandis]